MELSHPSIDQWWTMVVVAGSEHSVTITVMVTMWHDTSWLGTRLGNPDYFFDHCFTWFRRNRPRQFRFGNYHARWFVNRWIGGKSNCVMVLFCDFVSLFYLFHRQWVRWVASLAAGMCVSWFFTISLVDSHGWSPMPSDDGGGDGYCLDLIWFLGDWISLSCWNLTSTIPSCRYAIKMGLDND